ncbi:hypothetical protein [uncultured Pseudomonas sp.]|uniref:hypothetical protein n=1 Tax=uncultured Pseudomonas sp. TaxID=114707 RepID=UPI0025FD84B0|nr:hypothetical protein [uncultured Pseudomonas sp.]
MTIKRNRICEQCNNPFETSQYKAKFCSDTCRKKSRSNKTATNRIEKLPASDAWLWIARECQRAGTVEILQDVDLEKLFEIYNYRFKCYGWDSDKQKSKFHLCHISPVKGDNTIGLLHHQNLFVGGSLPNQVHSAKCYQGAGLSISLSALSKRWLTSKEESHAKTLEKVKKYLGQKLIEYAKKHPIKKAARFTLAERISKLPENTLPLSDLQKMGTQALRELEADLLGKSLYTISLTPKRSFVVYLEELERFASYTTAKTDDYLFVAAAVRTVAQLLAQNRQEHGLSSITATGFRWYYDYNPLSLKVGKELSKLRDFISFTAFNTLQGADVDRNLITNTLRSYLQVETFTVVEHGVPDFSCQFDLPYLTEELNEFSENVKQLKAAFCLVGLIKDADLYRIADKDKSIAFLNSYSADLKCREYYAYPDDYYQTEQPSIMHRNYAPSSWMPF